MKRSIVLLGVGVSLAITALAAFNPFADGAMADVRVCVVDDEGAPVSEAAVSLVFYTAPQKADVIRGMTDKNGVFCSRHRCTEELRVVVRKVEHYETVRYAPEYRQNTVEEATRTKRWSKGTVDIPIVLKRHLQPLKMTVHEVDFKPFPNTNKVVKLDLELLEWCPPYGNGKRDDLHLVFDGWRNPQDWDDYHEHLKVVFPNCEDGFYPLSVEPTSAFRYAYRAQTNAVYQKSFEFRHVHTADGVKESTRLPPDTYLIYRIRTQTNELGQVTHAHYGRIGEKLTQYFGLTMKSWFNPSDNDTNLEDARRR